MARVVQRRTSPPYLLILFVFLFLVSTGVAVMFYISADHFSKELVEEKQQYNKVIQSSDANDPVVKEMIENVGKTKISVVQQLRTQVKNLASGISVDPSYTVAQAAIDESKKKYNFASLVEVAEAATKRAADCQALVDQLNLAKQQLINEKEELAKSRDELMVKQVADLKALADQLKEFEVKVGAGHEDYQKQIAKVTAEISAKIADYEKRLNDMLTQVNKNKAEISKKDRRISELELQLASFQGTFDTSKVVVRPDGKIVRLLEDSKLAYINIGSKDKVTVGLTLSVYPSTGIPEDTSKVKGKLRVVNVFPDSAECTITQESSRDPLAQDDLVSNLAYDIGRVYNFVVDGQFDLRGAGEPSPTGLEDVKEMIKQSGGKITDQVDVQTDYVVLGEKPAAPAKPEAGAPPQVEKVYREQLKAIEHYQEIENQARALKRPILNAKQFIDLIGFAVPKSTK